MSVETLAKRATTTHDLAFAAGRKRQSPRTGLIHLFHSDASATDTIPLYENVCFALALCLQKKAETVLEAKDLLSRLFAFQTEEGNFPLYLHEYPRCYDPHQGLKIAPLFLRLISEFGSVLGADIRQKLQTSFDKILSFATKRRLEKPLSPLWECRYQALRSHLLPLDTARFSPTDWWEYFISLQLFDTPRCATFHPTLLAQVSPYGVRQHAYEPAPQLLEWAAAETLAHFSPRLLADHPLHMQLVALKGLALDPLVAPPDWHMVTSTDSHLLSAQHAPSESPFEHPLRLLWQGALLHSLVLSKGRSSFQSELLEQGINALLTLPKEFDVSQNDLCEVALYCNLSSETEILINGKKGTVFYLGDTLTICTPALNVELCFTLASGEGQFCGQLLRGNRSTQTAASGQLQYEAFDWKIALRTLRRASECAVRFHLNLL